MEANKTILQMNRRQADTYALMSEGVADMHCRSDEYLADELMLELAEKK